MVYKGFLLLQFPLSWEVFLPDGLPGLAQFPAGIKAQNRIDVLLAVAVALFDALALGIFLLFWVKIRKLELAMAQK